MTEPSTLDGVLYALADMVYQYAPRVRFYNKEAVCDDGISAMEGAFWELEKAGCKMNSNGTIQVHNLLSFMDAHGG